MRIGYRGFADDADIVVTPPSRVSYGLPVAARQLTTVARSVRLRRVAQRSGKALTLSWDALPEKELALLTFLPPDEVHTLLSEGGRELEVVFGEPTRSLTRYLTHDGQLTYAVDLPVFQVNRFTLSEVTPNSPPSNRLLAVATDLTRAAHAWPPQQPTPAYTPVLPAAAEGLPPGVKYGEGLRFTFKVSDRDTSLRYYSVDKDGWFEAAPVAPVWADWYSPVQDNRLVQARLRRAFFYPDKAWSLGLLFWRDANLLSGPILQAAYRNNALFLFHQDDTLTLVYTTDTGLTYTHQVSLTGGYHYLWAQMSYGTLQVSWNGAAVGVPPLFGRPVSVEDGVTLGGGGVLVDDLVLVNSDQVGMDNIRTWLLGGA
jgi:hypothetical protein